MQRNGLICILMCFALTPYLIPSVRAQATGTLEGRVTLPNDQPAHQASVMIVELGRIAETDAEGRYRFENLPAGNYEVIAYQSSLSGRPQRIDVPGDPDADFVLGFDPIGTQITVTATGREQTTFQAVKSVASMDTFELSKSMSTSIGEVLDGQLGIAKRSFGPGSSRPVIRGFDGDRVLVMQDGVGVRQLWLSGSRSQL